MMAKTITIIGSLNMDLVTVTDRMPVGGETMHASSFSTGAGGKGGNRKNRIWPHNLLPRREWDVMCSSCIGIYSFETGRY